MHLVIHHSTTYRYDEAASRIFQALRLWPIPGSGQVIRDWQVRLDGQRVVPTCRDGFGNPAATYVVDREVDSLRIAVYAEVQTQDRQGVLGDSVEPLPPAFFLNSTALTAPDPLLRELAGECVDSGDGEIAWIHRLCTLVRDRIDYQPDATHVATSAAEALTKGAGVCQDHAHVLIATARILGFPARYISGYLCAGAGTDAASHAWAEVFISGLGWVGFDAANRLCPDERYVRVAVGRDYRDAAPVRGVRHGGLAETMEVSVQIGDGVQ
jgi:transglutaminase-like putative cysteine protease